MRNADPKHSTEHAHFDAELEKSLLAEAERPSRKTSVTMMVEALGAYKEVIAIARRKGVGHAKIAEILSRKATKGGKKYTRTAVERFCEKVLKEPVKAARKHPMVRKSRQGGSAAKSHNQELKQAVAVATNKGIVRPPKDAIPIHDVMSDVIETQKSTPDVAVNSRRLPGQRTNPAFRQNDSGDKPL